MTLHIIPVLSALAVTVGLIAPHLNDDDEIIVPLYDEVRYILNGETVEVGSPITVKTLCYSEQTGYVESICDNPFGAGFTAFIVSYPWERAWTEYAAVEIEAAS